MTTATQARKSIRSMTDEEKRDLVIDLRRLKAEERAIEAGLQEIDHAAEKARATKRIEAHGKVSAVVHDASLELTRLLARAVTTGDYSRTPEIATSLAIGNPAFEEQFRGVVDRIIDRIPLGDLYTPAEIKRRDALMVRLAEVTQRHAALEPNHDETNALKIGHYLANTMNLANSTEGEANGKDADSPASH